MFLRLVAFLVSLLCVLVPVQPLAQAQLRGADPAAGAILEVAPAEVVLTFNEPVAPLQARWFAPDGRAQDAEARAEGPRLIVTAPAGLAEGIRALSWRVMSDDGHPVGGTHVFSIGVETGAAAAPTPWPAALARGVLTLSLAFGVGGLLWATLSGARVPGAQVLARASVPAAGLMLAAQAMDMAGTGPAALADRAAWVMALESPYGLAAMLAALVGVIAAGAQSRKPMVVFAFGLGALSFAVAGHAARPEPEAMMAPLVFARSLRLELGLMVAILALTAAFRLTPPPSALAELVETRVELHLHGRQARADISLIPGRPGPDRVEIVPLDADFRPVTPIEITLSFSRPAEGLKGIAVPAERGADGIWRAGPVHLPQAGAWEVIADIPITDVRKEMIGGAVTLLP